MGEWDNTAYVRSGDVDRVAWVIEDLLAREGRTSVPRPAPRTPAAMDSMQYGTGTSSPLWAMALVPAVGGWTIVKSAPFELLCERAPGSSRPRLAQIAAALKTDAIQVNLYDGDSVVVLEAAYDGAYRTSGFCASADDPLQFHDEVIAEDDLHPRFALTQVPDSLLDAFEGDLVEGVELVAAELGGASVAAWDNRIQVEALIPHLPLPAGWRELYFHATFP